MTPVLEVRGLRLSFGDRTILQGLNLTLRGDEIIGIRGPNGCGKTTLLRCIAGLQRHEAGVITKNGIEVTDVPVHRRGIGLVFQSTYLMPHMSVAGNLALGISRQLPRSRVKPMIAGALEDLGLEGYENRQANTLSGGEAQRIALMRAILAEPQVLLLDEPLASQDEDIRSRLGTEIRRILKMRGIPAILVTHDSVEARELCDRVLDFDSLQGGEEE